MLGKSLLFARTNPISKLLQLNAGQILAFFLENSCFAPEFHQSRLQCRDISLKVNLNYLLSIIKNVSMFCVTTLLFYLDTVFLLGLSLS